MEREKREQEEGNGERKKVERVKRGRQQVNERGKSESSQFAWFC